MQVGLWRDDGVYNLTRQNPQLFKSVENLIVAAERDGVHPLELVQEAAAALTGGPDYPWEALASVPVPAEAERDSASQAYLLPPLVPVEVWASGVTYERSRDARESETSAQTIYDKVYNAPRPELFLKSTALRVVGPNDEVCIRNDSNWQVPEPELGLVVNGKGQIVGITIGNDMTSRDIEGENPLYLAQAKIFRRSCSIGPSVKLIEGPPEPVDIICRILRGGEVVFSGETNTRQLRRSCEELVSYLVRDNVVYTPTVLLTGTGIVPPDEFTLHVGDVVEIEIPGVGVLRNPVVAA